MSLSIVIPAYNSARTIARCLQSIADQGLEGLQVVVVDDGSSDDIADRVADLKGELDLVYVRQPNSGVSVARNQGVSHASGDWVAFVDADAGSAPGPRASVPDACLPEHAGQPNT
jgi:glycosyltransferase involved in cell wall biosynthesis